MPTAAPPAGVHVSYTQQFRRCGKSDCPACRPGNPGHGPYWYAYWRESGRVRTRYIGKQAPDLMAPAPGEPQETTARAALRTRTLGAFQVWRGAERISADLWARRGATMLFKALLSVPGHRLHREQVSEILWPNADPAAHAVSLRGAVYRLRKALDGSGDSHILVRNGWLTLAPLPGGEPPPDWLDADWFEQSANQALDGQEVVACRMALLCYGGDYLPDDLYEEWAVRRREELRQLRLAVLMHLADLSAAHGDMSGARRALQAVLDADACHEVAVRALMRLHALGGQRAEAIRLYRRFAAALKSELAVQPEPETQMLLHALERQEPFPIAAGAEHAADRRHASLAPTWPLPPSNLPVESTIFIGRTRETAQLRQLLSHPDRGPGLLTLTGPDGRGKTRLALHTAAMLLSRYPDGVWLVELAAVAEPALLVPAVAAILGRRERPIDAPDSMPLDRLAAALRGKRLLLLLDNCEHLLDGCAELAGALLRRCPGLHILATSRAPLGITGETVRRVAPLSCPALEPGSALSPAALMESEAVRLFVARARVSRPGFSLTVENGPAVAAICRQLDGLPLAIELAAARLLSMPVEAIKAGLDTSFRLFSGNRRALPRRHILRATMEWSYALLTDAERRAFRRLSVLAGDWTLEAAEAFCASEVPQRLVATSLVQANLITLVSPADASNSVPSDGVRYRLLAPLRQYAAEQLAASGEAEMIRRRHWAWFKGRHDTP